MAIPLDSVDIQLLAELQADADRPNVELARLVGLSPAATLHRVRRLKESGIVRSIADGSLGSYDSVPTTGMVAATSFPWVTPLAVAGDQLFVSSNTLYRMKTDGNSWTVTAQEIVPSEADWSVDVVAFCGSLAT